MLEVVDEEQCRKVLVFCPTVDSAKLAASWVNAELGATVAVSIDGSIPTDRRKPILDRFQDLKGSVRFMFVCNLLREGYDFDAIDCVVILRPTKSRSLMEQMKGRGCRPIDGLLDGLASAGDRREAISGSIKPHCLVIDLVGSLGLGYVSSTVDVYAESLPDAIREHAIEIMAGGEEDPEKAIEEAERAAEERKRREEMERRAAEQEKRRLAAEVDYTVIDLPDGQKLKVKIGTPEWAQAQRISFGGKHAGERITKVPTKYLMWTLRSKSGLGNLRKAIQMELQRRKAKKPLAPTREQAEQTLEEINAKLQEMRG